MGFNLNYNTANNCNKRFVTLVVAFDTPMHHDKAVGSGKAGKALALPDFPPSVHFYINACVPRRTDRCIKRHMRY